MATFGKTDIGVNGGSLNGAGQRIVLCRFQLLENGVITSLTFRGTNGTAPGNMKGLIYQDVAAAPVGRLAVGDPVAKGLGNEWLTSPLGTPLVAPAGFYWLGWVAEGTDGNYQYDAGAVNQNIQKDAAGQYAAPPDPLVAPAFADRAVSVFATYTSASGGGSPRLRWLRKGQR